MQPPPLQMLQRTLRRMAPSRSAPGVDGLPCAARAAHEQGAVVIWQACCWMIDGRALFPSAGAAPQALLPKGCRAGDDDERIVVRAPDA
eukprot:9482343-Pyramimonas_sp.AAC.2